MNSQHSCSIKHSNREITEVRNHPGKFLHIYEIPEKYRGFRAENFSHTLEAINLQIKKEEELANEAIVKNYRGVELIFGITASGWYASRASFGEHSVQRAHEHDSTRRHHYKIVIMPCASNGNYQFYIGDGFPISLCLQDGQYPSIDTCTITHWANSQSWKYVEIETLDIQKGWIFVDGQDVYECTKRTIEENNARKLTERQQKFVAAKTAALEAGFTEAQIEGVVKTAPKGEKILFLKGGISLVKEGFSTFEVVDLLQDIKASNISVIQNYARLQKFAKQISVTQVQKVLDKAYAWSYLMNLLPQVTFTGYFDDAMDALRMGVERGIFPKSSFLLSRTYSKDQSLAVSSVIDGNRTSTYTLGEIESLQQLKKQLGE